MCIHFWHPLYTLHPHTFLQRMLIFIVQVEISNIIIVLVKPLFWSSSADLLMAVYSRNT